MFASPTLPQHLIRGLFAALLIAIALSPVPWWVAVPAVVTAMVLMRGCPMCWLVTNAGTSCPLPTPRAQGTES